LLDFQYKTEFLPNLSEHLEPIRVLQRKDAERKLTQGCQDAFNKVKEKRSKAPVLIYCDQDKT
jgi:hypothetical protein